MKKEAIQPRIHNWINRFLRSSFVGLPFFTSTIVICRYLMMAAKTQKEVR